MSRLPVEVLQIRVRRWSVTVTWTPPWSWFARRFGWPEWLAAAYRTEIAGVRFYEVQLLGLCVCVFAAQEATE